MGEHPYPTPEAPNRGPTPGPSESTTRGPETELVAAGQVCSLHFPTPGELSPGTPADPAHRPVLLRVAASGASIRRATTKARVTAAVGQQVHHDHGEQRPRQDPGRRPEDRQEPEGRRERDRCDGSLTAARDRQHDTPDDPDKEDQPALPDAA